MTARHASRLGALLVDDAIDGEVIAGESMARHTTYRIGGPARFFATADSLGALSRLVEACEETGTPWTVVGRGSNLLVADEGYDGIVITLGRDFRACRLDEERGVFSVGAGALLSTVVQEAFHRSLGGLEFAVGTPGTVGGAVRMNAGSRDEWLSGALVSVTLLTRSDGLVRVPASSIEWGYRSSSIAPEDVVVECELAATPADPFYVRGKMEAALSRRRDTQPLSEPSCGSVFKGVNGTPAGKLIEDAGLKGAQVGGARVSEKHANFIVNTGSATASDVRALMKQIQTKVYEDYGVELEPEVRLLGFE